MIKNKNLRKRIIVTFGVVTLMAALSGCGKKDATSAPSQEPSQVEVSETTTSVEPTQEVEDTEASQEPTEAPKKNVKEIDQLADVKKGETVATLKIKDYGDIKVKFFPDDAPKAVENFITHAKDGYYNGVTFHRVINDFMIQGGDPQGTGMGGESIWNSEFEDEISPNLIPLRGALCMANAGGGNTNGSQFFIVQSQQKEEGDVKANLENYLNSYKQKTGCPLDAYNDIVVDNYNKVGGCLFLSGGYTVFGQVYEGQEIVDKIAATETDGSDKPLNDVVIESIEVTEYK